MAIAAVNYKESFFEHTELTPIIGRPNYKSLHRLHQEIKTNAMTVHSNLGGGAFGYLGLVMTPSEYAFISPVPFVKPIYPGPLTIPPGLSVYKARQLATDHKEILRLFHESRGVERALLQQLVAAIDPAYISPVCDRRTGHLQNDILGVIQYLKYVYGKFSPAELAVLHDEVTKFTYNPNKPIDTVFNRVKDLMEYGTLAKNPYSLQQMIQIAYTIINSTGKFKQGIIEWNRSPPQIRTWLYFKEHFSRAHQELDKTNQLTMENAGYHGVNIVQEIMSQLDQKLESFSNDSAETELDNYLQTANAASTPPPSPQDIFNQKILEKLESLTKSIERLPGTVNNENPSNGPRCYRRCSRNPTAPRSGQPSSPLDTNYYNKYCWTHGRSRHSSDECNSCAPGHKTKATFANKLGGSTYGCE